MIKFETGNIFDSKAPILGHGCNTKGAMASGLAPQFRDKYPDMHQNYVDLCKVQESKRLVGTAAIYTGHYNPFTNEGKIIANIFSQDLPGANASYEWAMRGINAVMNFAIQNGYDSFALPRIGSGIGGLDWDTMSVMIFDNFEKFDVDVELWTYEP